MESVETLGEECLKTDIVAVAAADGLSVLSHFILGNAHGPKWDNVYSPFFILLRVLFDKLFFIYHGVNKRQLFVVKTDVQLSF